MMHPSKPLRTRPASRLALAAMLCLLCGTATSASAQEAGGFSTVIKVTRLPEVGATLHFTERLSVRALAGIQTNFGDGAGGIGNVSLLYRLGTVSPGLSDYVGAGVTTLGFDDGLWLGGVLYGLRYQVTDRLHFFGEVGLDVGEQGNEALISLINNTGLGLSYRF